VTQQQSETLRYRGREYTLLGLPLDTCTDPEVKERIDRLMSCSTALHRGYLGVWEVKAGRLWLTSVGELVARDAVHRFISADLTWLFPGSAGPVLADWFTGEIASPRGEARRGGQYRVVWPRHRVFHIERGVVTGTELRDNQDAYRAGIARQAGLGASLKSL